MHPFCYPGMTIQLHLVNTRKQQSRGSGQHFDTAFRLPHITSEFRKILHTCLIQAVSTLMSTQSMYRRLILAEKHFLNFM